MPAEPHWRNTQRQAGRVVGLDRKRAQGGRAVGGLELAGRDAAHEALQRLGLVHADDGVVVAGHADVGHERGTARQHAMVGGRHVRVGAHHQARTAIAKMPHRLLLARRLAMDVDHDRVGGAFQRTGGKLAVDRREGIVERVHEHAAHRVDDQHARAIARIEHRHAAPRRTGRIIERADQPRRARDEYQRLALVPRMVAERDGVGAGIHHLVVDRLGNAEAAGRVLAVDDDAIELPVAHEPGQPVEDDRASGAPHHVADEKKPHAFRIHANR